MPFPCTLVVRTELRVFFFASLKRHAIFNILLAFHPISQLLFLFLRWRRLKFCAHTGFVVVLFILFIYLRFFFISLSLSIPIRFFSFCCEAESNKMKRKKNSTMKKSRSIRFCVSVFTGHIQKMLDVQWRETNQCADDVCAAKKKTDRTDAIRCVWESETNEKKYIEEFSLCIQITSFFLIVVVVVAFAAIDAAAVAAVGNIFYFRRTAVCLPLLFRFPFSRFVFAKSVCAVEIEQHYLLNKARIHTHQISE